MKPSTFTGYLLCARHFGMDSICKGKWMKIPALIQFTIQKWLVTIPLLDNAIMHLRKKFYGAQRAYSVCLVVPGDTWQEQEHLRSIWKEKIFLFQLSPHSVGRRKQWLPSGKRQFKHPWYPANCFLNLWKKWLFAAFLNPGKSVRRYSVLGNIAFIRKQWIWVVLGLNLLWNWHCIILVICLALQPLFSWL